MEEEEEGGEKTKPGGFHSLVRSATELPHVCGMCTGAFFRKGRGRRSLRCNCKYTVPLPLHGSVHCFHVWLAEHLKEISCLPTYLLHDKQLHRATISFI